MDGRSPEDVLLAISSALKIDGYTRVTAAEKLGMKPGTLSNILSSKKYLSPKQAERFSLAFGLNQEFLTKGIEPVYAKPYLPKNIPEQRLARNPQKHALTVINDNQQGDIELMLYWFHEAAYRRGDKDGLTLWAEVSRFAQAKSLVANSMRGFRGTNTEADEEYQWRLMELEGEIITNVEALLDKMGGDQ